jgi:hypothetical protein
MNYPRCFAALNMTFASVGARAGIQALSGSCESWLLRARPSRRSRNAFFRAFLRLAHGIYVAASVVGLRRRGARSEVGEHLGVSALCAGSAIEFR